MSDADMTSSSFSPVPTANGSHTAIDRIGAVFAASFSEWRNARAVELEAHLDPARQLEAAVVLLH